MGESRVWPALVIKEGRSLYPPTDGAEAAPFSDLLSALLDDFSPAAIEDLNELPLPPGGLWDPTFPPLPEPAAAPLAWRVFFPSNDQRDAAAAAVRRELPQLEATVENVPDENWAARSQAALRAITAGRFIIAPPWDLPTPAANQIVIVIEPSRGFGTGHHASTRLCLRALSGVDACHARVLDLGTGSGVLALAAAFSGAREVLAIDVDGDAIDAARESAASNPTPIAVDFRVSDFRTDLAIDQRGANDIVFGNLTGGMLISSAPRIREFVAPGGRLILSGFDEGELPAVQAALLPLRPEMILREDGWIGMVLRTDTRGE